MEFPGSGKSAGKPQSQHLKEVETRDTASVAMKSTLRTFPALLTLGLCIHLIGQMVESQHVPTRCMCLKSRNGVQGPFSDFTVKLKGPGCMRDEIIVVLKKDNRQVCLRPQGPQGKRLLKCWHKKLKEGNNGKTCMGRLRPRPQKRQHVKPKSIT